MKAGGTLAVDLHDLAPDFQEKVCAPKWKQAFPLGLLRPEEWATCAAGVFIRAKGDGAPRVTKGFNVILLANQKPKDFEKELRDSLGFAWAGIRAIHLEH